MKQDDLGDRMKLYENLESDRRLCPLLPIIARIDGRAFHSFTKGMKKPYDDILSRIMIDTTKWLVKETNACIGYCQSDEISLCFYSNNIKSETFFDRRIAKLTSSLAAMASVYFFKLITERLSSNYINKLPTFDCRVWTVPSKMEAVNYFVWRQQDATKNSISMAARSVYSHKDLQNKNSANLQELLFKKGINWNNYPSFFKSGTFIQRTVVSRIFNYDEIENLPTHHNARTNNNLVIKRTEYTELDMPPLVNVCNREKVIFNGNKPIAL